MIFIATDILNPYKRDILSQESYPALIDFLVDEFPNGFKRPTDISVNGHIIEVDDYDIALNNDDIVVLLDRAALPVGLIGGWFITALANLAISVTLSYVANKLFAPDAPQEQGTPSPVYNLNSAQNTARYGSPIPIIYGKVRMYPSMIAQPFYRFEDNVEYLYHTLCVGQGTNTTDKILIAEDEITSAGDLQWKLLYQSDFYNIPLKGFGYHITNTLETPSNMKLINDTSNPEAGESEKYRISKDASQVEIDYIYPNGLSWVKGDGSYDKTYTAFTYRIYTLSGTTYTQVASGVIDTNAYSIDAIQKTHVINTSAYTQDIYISFEKTYGANDSRTTNDTYIKRVKEVFPNEDFTQLYGDITVLVCKIKATNAVSSAGQLKVNGYFTRTDVGNTMAEVLTDIYTNTTYGGGLSASDLSFPTTYEVVNCAYDSNMTIFDAMRRPAIAQGYSLYLAGMDVILKKDAPNTITSGMYNEMNILRNSFKAQYLFKEEYPANDGFKCTYIDGDGWIQKSEIYPATSSRPQVVDLFGVVDYGQIPTLCGYYYYDKAYTSFFSDSFSSLASWFKWGSPLSEVITDAEATNGKSLNTNGDLNFLSGVVLNAHPLPINKAFRVRFRAKQPYWSAAGNTTYFYPGGDSYYFTYFDVILTTAPGISSTTDGTLGATHASIRIDGGKYDGSAPYEKSIYYDSVGTGNGVASQDYDNDGGWHEYEILYYPIGDGTAGYILKIDGVAKHCSRNNVPGISNYYLAIEGRAQGPDIDNHIDWITVEVEP